MKITEFGPIDGPQILAVPGLFMSAEAFRDLAAYLPECHIVAVTLDAHYEGSDEYPGREEELNRLTDKLMELGYTHFRLCIGLSLGTIMSVCLAQREEIRIEQFLLDGAVNFYRSPAAFLEKAAMSMIFHNLMRRARSRKAASGMLNFAYTGSWASVFDECQRSMTDESIDILIRELSDFTPTPGLEQPMYCLYGSLENNILANRRAIKKAYPQARFSLKMGHNHLTWLNRNPEKYAKLVRRILESESREKRL